jgi:serine/threonine protein kinase
LKKAIAELPYALKRQYYAFDFKQKSASTKCVLVTRKEHNLVLKVTTKILGRRIQQALLKLQDFSNIAKPIAVHEHETNDYCYILFECHQNHHAICETRSFTAVRKYSIGLLRALEHIHANGLIHANVRLHNVLLSQENDAVLTNFEHSSLIADKNTDIKLSDY